jgi:hypothetical protein
MKELLPLNLSELTFKSVDVQPNKGEQVDPKELRKSLGLKEDATDELVLTKLAEAKKLLADPPKPENTQLSEITKLAESNPIVAQFLEQQKQNTQALAEMQNQLRLSETTRRLSELTGPTAKVQFSAAGLNEIRDLMITAPTALAENIFKAFKSIATGEAVVSLGELGQPGDPSRQRDAGLNPIEEFNAAIAAVTKDGMPYADAVEHVALSNRQLYADYRNASYIKPLGA